MKFTVDRKTWFRGKGSLRSRLIRNEDDKMCCLGFLGLACGIPREALRNRGMPLSVPYPAHQLWPLFLKEWSSRGCYASPARTLATLNDNVRITDAEREQKLKAEFAANGVEVEFTG